MNIFISLFVMLVARYNHSSTNATRVGTSASMLSTAVPRNSDFRMKTGMTYSRYAVTNITDKRMMDRIMFFRKCGLIDWVKEGRSVGTPIYWNYFDSVSQYFARNRNDS